MFIKCGYDKEKFAKCEWKAREVDAFRQRENQVAHGKLYKISTADMNASDNIYDEIVKASVALDDELVPETGRVLTVTPVVYLLMKKYKDITMETEVGNDMRIKGVIANIDGALTIKMAAARLPEDFGFMLSQKSACCALAQLADYRTHENPPGISGTLVEGRIVYDAFVFENKAKAIYYQAVSAS